jgi:phage-related protein
LKLSNFYDLKMGFLSFLKGIGGGIMSGIGKVAGIVKKVAPIVQGIAGAIPTPLTQGIANAAGAVGSVANAVAPAMQNGDYVGALTGGLNAAGATGAAQTVQNVANAVQGGPPAGAPVI